MADKLTFEERTERLAQAAKQLQECIPLLQMAVVTLTDEVRSMHEAQARFAARDEKRKGKAGN